MPLPRPRFPSVCLLASLAWSAWACAAAAQASAALSDPLADFEAAGMLFEADAYAPAATRLSGVLSERQLAGVPQLRQERIRAELLRALAAQRAGLPEADVLLERFVARYSPRPVALEAIRQVADVAFGERDYARAIELYRELPENALAGDQRDAVRFRLGYAAFATKDFATAGRYLGNLRDSGGEYAEPATYYYALTRFFQDDYAGAKAAFETLGDSERYAAVIPGYLAQIYFAEGDYARVIEYATPQAKRQGVRQRDRLELLIGRSHFELGQYPEALPHLEAYALSNREMSAEDFYQLGYSQYAAGAFYEASENLKQLAGEDSPLGQVALYYLGNAYLEQGMRAEARPAFSAVSRMDYDDQLREEAAFNVAKLNYELGYSQEALSALRSIPESSRYYPDAQRLLARVIAASRDYAAALEILEEFGELSPELREVRQQVRVLRALQLLRDGQPAEARPLLTASLEGGEDPYYTALANFWLGDLAAARGRTEAAIRYYTAYLTGAKAVDAAFPADANPATANYNLGFLHLKREEYGSALGYYQEAIAQLEARLRVDPGERVSQLLLADATLRAGDANFKRNDYAAAADYYERAAAAGGPNAVYARYQSAIIEGLTGDVTDKIIALETIVDDYPDSDFADDALFELGTTYQSTNRLKAASGALERLLEAYPDSELENEALVQLGLVSYNQGSAATAIDYYKRVFANEPKATEVRAAQEGLREIYIEDLGKPDDYLAFLESVPGVKLDDTVRDSISYGAARAQYQSGEYERAVAQYSDYIEKFPRGSNLREALYRRADSYLLLERYPEALADLERVVALGPGEYYAQSLSKAAQLAYDATGDFAKAHAYYQKLLSSGSQLGRDPETRLMALRAAYRAEQPKAVYAIADSLLTGAGSSTPERLAVASFYRGKVAYDRKDYDKALESFNAVIRLDQGEAAAEARFRVARIYFLRGELDLAESIAIKTQRQSAGYPYWVARATLLLVDVFLSREDYLSARAVAEGLVENYRGDDTLEEAARRKLAEVSRAAAANSRVRATDTSALELQDLPDDAQ